MTDRAALSRKRFLTMLAATAGSLVATRAAGGAPSSEASIAAAAALAGDLPHRRLGATGEAVTILGLGGWHLGSVGDEASARTLVETALAEGIRFVDTAQAYQNGGSEAWLGAALAGARDDVFLMTKTHDVPARSYEGAKRHLGDSLTRLRTDRLDLWQLHQVETVEDADQAFAPGAAMEYLMDAKAEGLVRHIGITGHARPQALLRALEHFDRGLRFDTIQMPINPIDFHQRSFQRQVLPEVLAREIGVIAMKTSAWGALPQQKVCTIEECQRFAWGLPVSVAVVGMTSVEEIRENARRAREAPAMDANEMDALLARVESRKDLALEWYKAT